MKFTIGESQPKKKKIFSELIKWFEGTKHSHVFVSWKDENGLRWVAEAKGSGIRMVSNVQFKSEVEIVNIYHYEVDQDGIDKVTKYIWSKLAHKYGFKQIYGLAEMRVLNKIYRSLGLKRKAKNRFTDGDASQICCEFGVRTAEVVLKKELVDESLEQWGLIETAKFTNKTGKKAPIELLNRINGN